MKHSRFLFGFATLATSSLCLAQNEQCAALQSSFTDANIRITKAEYQTASTTPAGPFGAGTNLPTHCHVEGDFDRRTGADGKPYSIRFAISLPENWNGRFMFQGGGGLNGTLGEPTGGQATGDTSALSQGFAVASTDSGHSGSVFDSSFMADQEAMLNFYYLANARVTEVVRPMVEAYYRDDIDYSYFVGCSTGGREGMIMAQRHPMLFDGIVSGAPAIRTGLSNLGLRWISDQLNQAGNTRPGDPFTDEEEDLIMSALMNSCDALDGQKDGLIMNTEACDFNPAELSCSVAEGPACLADDKAQALAKAMGGPVDSRGEQVYPRFRFDSGIDDTGGIPGLLLAGGSPPVPNPTANTGRQNVDAEFIEATSTDSALGDSTQYNISTFIAGGGKHLFYHGVSDPWFSAQDTVDYFTKMGTTNANLKPLDEYSALYLVPGAGHCQGGQQTLDRFDMLTPLVEWVENGVAPDGIVATGRTMPGVSRPLCPFPGYAEYLGSGDVNLAENYACHLPE